MSKHGDWTPGKRVVHKNLFLNGTITSTWVDSLGGLVVEFVAPHNGCEYWFGHEDLMLCKEVPEENICDKDYLDLIEDKDYPECPAWDSLDGGEEHLYVVADGNSSQVFSSFDKVEQYTQTQLAHGYESLLVSKYMKVVVRYLSGQRTTTSYLPIGAFRVTKED